MRSMRTVQERHSTMERIRELTRDTDTGNQFQNMAEFGVKNIRRTVWRGGVYLGVCNGAYIAGKQVKYNDYSGNRIKHGGLGLFPGTTFGPVFPGICAGGSIANTSGGMPVDIVDAYGQSHTVWYHNGGTFPGLGGRSTDYRVHAVYDTDDSFPAIVSFRYGSGTVILSGIHPEFDGEGMDETSYRLFDGIFRKLGVVRT